MMAWRSLIARQSSSSDIAHVNHEQKEFLEKVFPDMCVGSGFKEQDFIVVAKIIFRISSAECGSNLSKTAGDGCRFDSGSAPSVACNTDATWLLKT